jgi:hypothetical protein
MSDKVDHVEGIPDPLIPIVPVIGEIVEIQFDTVGEVLYALVIEYKGDERWTLCYRARAYGYQLLWLFRALPREEWAAAMAGLAEDVVDISRTVEDDVDTLVVTQEGSRNRTVMFFQGVDGVSDWVPCLVLTFDLSSPVGWSARDRVGATARAPATS